MEVDERLVNERNYISDNIADKIVRHLEDEKFKIRTHGNGFLQIFLKHDKRLHVWDKIEFPMSKENNADIHTHTWNMNSEVVAGELTHYLFDLTDLSDRLIQTGIVHDVYSIHNTEDKHSFVHQKTVRIKDINYFTLVAGSNYSQSADTFHRSVASNAITIMRKSNSIFKSEEKPKVLCNLGETPFDAFGHQQPSRQDLIEAFIRSIERYSLKQMNYIHSTLMINT